jgi:type IV pilus assembly protein PilE
MFIRRICLEPKFDRCHDDGGRWSRMRGLTLIELMVVIAVLAILATIAVPTYERYQRSARRADGKAALTAVALAQERAFSVYQYYVPLTSLDDWAGLDVDIASGKSPKQRYKITLSERTATSFTADAEPDPPSADPDCGTLQISSTGAKTLKAGTHTKTVAECW